jgi:hypothetical protein
MGKAEQKAKNSAMAAMMKEKGIRRTTARCSLCLHIVPIPIDRHLATCKGPSRKTANR